MNRERIKILISQISKVPRSKFNMGSWFRGVIRKTNTPIANENHTCGTSACIAGWTLLLFDENPQDNGAVSARAQGLLSLDNKQANNLFYGYEDGRQIALSTITNLQAVNVLNHLLETGEVDWSKRNAKPS